MEINSNLSAELLRRATENIRRLEKQAFVAMPGGQVADPNQQIGGMMDPNSPQNPGAAAQMGGATPPPTGPDGMPVDPATGQPLQDPNAQAAAPAPAGGMDPQTMYMVMVQAMRQVFQETGFGQQAQGQPGQEAEKPKKSSGSKATMDEINQKLSALLTALGVSTPDQAQAAGIPAPPAAPQPMTTPLGPTTDPAAAAGGAQGFGPQAGAPAAYPAADPAQGQPKTASATRTMTATDRLMAAAAMLKRK
jgi:hypothetical protein